MIHYQLRCREGHGFEGWFRDSRTFEEQSGRKLLTCPQCGTAAVQRAMMAPAVQSSRKPPGAAAASDMQSPAERTEVAMPDQLRAAFQRLRAEIEQRCDDVGDRFAEAARKLHRDGSMPGKAPRGIYGQVSEAEREALADEGIETTQIPWLPPADS